MVTYVFPTKSRGVIQLSSAKQTHAVQMLMVCLKKTIKFAFPPDSATFREGRARGVSLTVCAPLTGAPAMENATL